MIAVEADGLEGGWTAALDSPPTGGCRLDREFFNPFSMRAALSALALVGLLTPVAQAQIDPHRHHRMMAPAPAGDGAVAAPMDHSAHNHDVGPAGSTYDLRWIDGMVGKGRLWSDCAPESKGCRDCCVDVPLSMGRHSGRNEVGV